MRREAADPVLVFYRDEYWLFASKQKGYWHSSDLLRWNIVEPKGLPLDIYAPSVTVINNKLYYMSGNANGTFTTADPLQGDWVNVAGFARGTVDPAVFQDADGRVYLYDGCSDKTPLRVAELDRNSFQPLTERVPVIYADTANHGWEIAGDDNRGRTENDLSSKSVLPWIEGSYMNKINGKYYLQYAAPGTQFKTYGDGIYTADNPTGPFTYAVYSPFSFKPTGFITGAGHSSTVQDKAGNYWHIATGTISVRHSFERRLSLFPAAVLADGQLATNTYLGDYPQFAPGTAKEHLLGNLPMWMLLSYNKKATASSVFKDSGNRFEITNAFDEDIRTWWAAATGNKGEWLQVDLQKLCTVRALQINFADQDCQLSIEAYTDGYQYKIEASADGNKWTIIVDRSGKPEDTPHDYIQLTEPVRARYIKITNVHYPANGKFSLYDFRIFGKAPGNRPSQVKHVSVVRDINDGRRVHLNWNASEEADFYIVRYGIKPDRLFGNYQVYKRTGITINSLNKGADYYFTVDAVNATGISKGVPPVKAY